MTVRHIINYHYSGFLLITIENIYRASHAREASDIVAVFTLITRSRLFSTRRLSLPFFIHVALTALHPADEPPRLCGAVQPTVEKSHKSLCPA